MSDSLSARELPERPHPDHLREQAKDLLQAYRNSEPDAVQRFAALPFYGKSTPALHDAQSVIAREYGFPSWVKLLDEVDRRRAGAGVTPEVAKQYVEAACLGRPQSLPKLLALYPDLPRFDPATRLVSGLRADVQAGEPLEPLGWKPIEYVAYSRLHQVLPTAYEGLESEAKRLLEVGADPNTLHEFGDATLPVLFGATCESRHPGSVKLLLAAGAKPNDGESIYHAAQYNLREMLQLLLDAGADLSMADPQWGNTPLFFNAGHRRTDVDAPTVLLGCEWLLEHGADPNVRSGDQQETPLIQACRSGFTPLVTLLLRHRADPKIRSKEGLSAYKWAVVLGNAEAARAIEEAGGAEELSPAESFLAACAKGVVPPDKPHLTDRELLLINKLAELGSVEGVRACLAAGFSANSVGGDGETPLHYAAFCGWATVVQELLVHGGDINAKDSTYDATPIQWAAYGAVWNRNAEGDYVGVVHELLASGADRQQLIDTAEYGEIEAERLRDVLDAV